VRFDVEALEEFWSAALDRLKVFAEAEACERLSADERSSPTVAAIAESANSSQEEQINPIVAPFTTSKSASEVRVRHA
jgi:hypothetical protein